MLLLTKLKQVIGAQEIEVEFEAELIRSVIMLKYLVVLLVVLISGPCFSQIIEGDESGESISSQNQVVPKGKFHFFVIDPKTRRLEEILDYSKELNFKDRIFVQYVLEHSSTRKPIDIVCDKKGRPRNKVFQKIIADQDGNIIHELKPIFKIDNGLQFISLEGKDKKFLKKYPSLSEIKVLDKTKEEFNIKIRYSEVSNIGRSMNQTLSVHTDLKLQFPNSISINPFEQIIDIEAKNVGKEFQETDFYEIAEVNPSGIKSLQIGNAYFYGTILKDILDRLNKGEEKVCANFKQNTLNYRSPLFQMSYCFKKSFNGNLLVTARAKVIPNKSRIFVDKKSRIRINEDFFKIINKKPVFKYIIRVLNNRGNSCVAGLKIRIPRFKLISDEEANSKKDDCASSDYGSVVELKNGMNRIEAWTKMHLKQSVKDGVRDQKAIIKYGAVLENIINKTEFVRDNDLRYGLISFSRSEIELFLGIKIRSRFSTEYVDQLAEKYFSHMRSSGKLEVGDAFALFIEGEEYIFITSGIGNRNASNVDNSVPFFPYDYNYKLMMIENNDN